MRTLPMVYNNLLDQMRQYARVQLIIHARQNFRANFHYDSFLCVIGHIVFPNSFAFFAAARIPRASAFTSLCFLNAANAA